MDSEELQFPLNCHFRVIAENRKGMYFVIETVLMQNGVTAPLQNEHESAGGKYMSYSVDVRVESLERMNSIDAALRSIEGVKIVM